MEHIKRCYLIPFATGIALLFLHGFVSIFLPGSDFRILLIWLILLAAVISFNIGIAERILAVINKRCYLIPFVASLALLLGIVDIFLLGGGIEFLIWPVFLAAAILFYIGVAESISAVIYRQTAMSTVLGTAFLVFFAVQMPSYLGEFIFMLPFIGIVGVASAFFNGRTATAIVSGTAVLAHSIPFLIIILGAIISNHSLDSLEFLIILLSFLTGGGILAVAFITHTNIALSKLRAFYLISLIWFIPFQFLFFDPGLIPGFVVEGALFSAPAFISERILLLIWASILTGGGVLAVAFIAHLDMELSKKALYIILPILLAPFLLFLLAWRPFDGDGLFIVKFALWESLQYWIIAGCIMMGINGVIYTNDSNIITI